MFRKLNVIQSCLGFGAKVMQF